MRRSTVTMLILAFVCLVAATILEYDSLVYLGVLFSIIFLWLVTGV